MKDQLNYSTQDFGILLLTLAMDDAVWSGKTNQHFYFSASRNYISDKRRRLLDNFFSKMLPASLKAGDRLTSPSQRWLLCNFQIDEQLRQGCA
jgi:hypothetical protein